MTNQYLPLTEYSSKYRVSISTLRRRIKAEDIAFLFEDGKYLILDGPMSTHQRVHRPSPINSEDTLMGAQTESTPSGAIIRESAPMFGFQSAQHGEPKISTPSKAGPSAASKAEKAVSISEQSPAGSSDEPVLAVANRLLTELKKAYSQILHEKEGQILHLNEELADLKTLVRVLESENDRLSRQRK